MGAFMQPQGQLQVILNMKHYLSNPQHALDLPRLCIAPPKNGEGPAYTFTEVKESVIYLEEGISSETIKELEAKGHVCYVLKNHSRAMFGRGQIIRSKKDARTGTRVLAAGSDPRGDGCATGW
jgi:gamma-glutamyltranspeptidase/glutathione hydrolase